MSKILIFIILIFSMFFSISVFAQEKPTESTPVAESTQAAPAPEGIFEQGLSDACKECGECSQCDGAQVVINIVNFLFNIAGPLAVLTIILGGFVYITSGGIPERTNMAKGAVTAGIVGFVIILIAWTGVDFVIKLLGYEKAGSWARPSLSCQNVPCGFQSVTGGVSNGGVSAGGVTTPPAGYAANVSQGCSAPFKAQSTLDASFQKYGAQYGLDPYFLKSVATLESGLGKNKGPSYTGAGGIMQFQPSTAVNYVPASAPASCKKKVTGSEQKANSNSGYCRSSKKKGQKLDPTCCEIKPKASICEVYAADCGAWINSHDDEVIGMSAHYYSDLKNKTGSYYGAVEKYSGDRSGKYYNKLVNKWQNYCGKEGGTLK